MPKYIKLILLAVGALLVASGPRIEGCPIPGLTISDRPDAAVYVYERNSGGVPSGVSAGIGYLNTLEPPILATTLVVTATDGTGDVPEQYKVPFAAAKEAGIPALVVTAKNKVVRTVKSPVTKTQVLEAVK